MSIGHTWAGFARREACDIEGQAVRQKFGPAHFLARTIAFQRYRELALSDRKRLDFRQGGTVTGRKQQHDHLIRSVFGWVMR
ncbi:hypothetical protein M3P36_08975 [Altererythrobacter sp. KTW20L]|uniref:hypothetical protein n=1 Tax=Altererythrobacter sp. KTW20L TaxID=2942210 RepID=UPI0020C03CEF|nr:hypothetical protein [Altererythrobacter sp. KTW20L]MCL6251174.1 hypothetical protein [Altererythrobacter sp. KTW20L]